MAANRPSSFVVIDGATTYNFPIAPTQNGMGQSIRWTTNPWQMGDVPAIALKDFGFRIQLFPFTGGLGSSKIFEKDTFRKANAETEFNNIVAPAPKRVTWTLANQNAPVKSIEFDAKMFYIDGRYLYYLPLTGDVTVAASVLDKDFGVGNGAVDAAVFQSELVVAMGPNTNIWRRFTVADTLSGTANAAVTTTNTSLTDTRLSGLTGSKYVGSVITCNGKTMTVTSVSGGNTFNGSGGWSGGGNPGNGFAWSMDPWAQHTDAVRALAYGVVDDTLWKGTLNQVSGALSYPHLTASYAASYPVGDSTYNINTIVDFVGGVWVGKADGMYLGDPSGKYHNQAPQLRRFIHPNNCKGSFVAHGSLWVPSASGLLRLNGGSSLMAGPEVVKIPNAAMFWVAGGVEWNGNIYLAVYDQASDAFNNFNVPTIIKMVRDPGNKNKYTFHQLMDVATFDRPVTSIAVSATPTVPYLFVTASNGTTVFGICLSRGGGRSIDDVLHKYNGSTFLLTGNIIPARDDFGVTSYVEGFEAVIKLVDANSNFHISYARDNDTAYLATYDDAEALTGTNSVGPLFTYTRVIKYTTPGFSSCQSVEARFDFAHSAALAGQTRDELVDAYVFGYHRPKQTDRLIVSLIADGATMNGNGVASGLSLMDMHTQFGKWVDQSTLIEIQLQDYQENKPTRFLVTHVERTNVEIENRDHADILQVTLVRIPHAPGYGVI